MMVNSLPLRCARHNFRIRYSIRIGQKKLDALANNQRTPNFCTHIYYLRLDQFGQRYAPKSIKSSQRGESTKVKSCCIHTRSREQSNLTFAIRRFKRTNPNTLNAFVTQDVAELARRKRC